MGARIQMVAGLAAVIAIALAVSPALATPRAKPVPWSCKAIERPVLDREASAGARPMKYRNPDWVSDIGAYGRDHPDAWADLYYDHSPKGNDSIFIHVLLTKDLRRHARVIRGLSKRPNAVIFSRAAATSIELRETARQIGREQFKDPPSPDFGVTATWLAEDPSKNLLEIGLYDYRASAAEAMRERYGSRVCVLLKDARPTLLRP